jgi:hypothetical protein
MAGNQTLIIVAPTQRSPDALVLGGFAVAPFCHFLHLSLHDRQSSKDISQVVANGFIAGVLNVR